MPLPELPLEIWSKIVTFKCLMDHKIPQAGAESWLQLRRVSRIFASIVEKHNITRYLHHMSIEHEQVKQQVRFRFVGFDEENPRLAVLVNSEKTNWEPLGRRLARERRKKEETFRVQQIVGIRSNAYEIPLIHMKSQIEPETQFSIKFDWRATFSVWWAERKFLALDRQRNVESNIAFAENLEAAGDYPWYKLHDRCIKQRLVAMRKIRRKRIIRLLRRLDGARLGNEDVIAKRHLCVVGERAAIHARQEMQNPQEERFSDEQSAMMLRGREQGEDEMNSDSDSNESDDATGAWRKEDWAQRFHPFAAYRGHKGNAHGVSAKQ